MLNRADKLNEGGPRYGDKRGKGAHKGIDLKAPAGTLVRSAGTGAIVAISPNPSPSYGVQVVIYHGNGVYTHYAHLQPGSPTLRPGTKVKAGDVIGRVGRTGNTPSTGDTHLHFEVRIGSPRPVTAGGKTSDPLKLLPRSRP
ncbi:peptidoglycan DD-metalloendopeptidase family protein [Novosphingobium ginsenosidimutans]